MANSGTIVVLTGAGISAESGIQTFRDQNGLWENHRVEEVASPDAFDRNPALVHRFYNTRRRQLLSDEVQANAAHRALARLQRDYPGDVLLVTQNVDDLHERGGSPNVLHMHGELLKKRCVRTGQVTDQRSDLSVNDRCECCDQTGTLRPNIVWFGEMPMEVDRIEAALHQCRLMVSIGTSGHVYPAAGFVTTASRCGAQTVELNLEPSVNQSLFDESVYGLATQVVPDFVEQLLQQSRES